MAYWSILISGQIIPIDKLNVKKQILLVGRSDNCDIVIATNDVSKEHAEIHKTPTLNPNYFEYFVKDIGSSNGTFIKKTNAFGNGIHTDEWVELPIDEFVQIHSGDTVKFGDTDITFTFQEELVQTGGMYLAEILREQSQLDEELEERNIRYKNKEETKEKPQFLSQIVDFISNNNPFSNKD